LDSHFLFRCWDSSRVFYVHYYLLSSFDDQFSRNGLKSFNEGCHRNLCAILKKKRWTKYRREMYIFDTSDNKVFVIRWKNVNLCPASCWPWSEIGPGFSIRVSVSLRDWKRPVPVSHRLYRFGFPYANERLPFVDVYRIYSIFIKFGKKERIKKKKKFNSIRIKLVNFKSFGTINSTILVVSLIINEYYSTPTINTI